MCGNIKLSCRSNEELPIKLIEYKRPTQNIQSDVVSMCNGEVFYILVSTIIRKFMLNMMLFVVPRLETHTKPQREMVNIIRFTEVNLYYKDLLNIY